MAVAAEVVDTQVVVVGAGPVGLMLAGELRLGGADVVVVDRRHEPSGESRASTLHARTMEIFDSRGLLEIFGSPPCDPRGHFGGIPLDLTLPGPHPGQWKVPQTRSEAVLEEWALDLGADIRCGHELTALTQQDSLVDAQVMRRDGPLRLRCRYLVACDGEDSTVRRLTGAAFPGHDARRELLRADVDGIRIPARRFERLPRGLAISAQREDGVTRVMVHEWGSKAGPPSRAVAFEEVADTWRRVTGEDISGGVPVWVNAFGDASRQLAAYRHGRVLFAGDAAHRQLPTGGQALNLGVQDAFNLGWKLALVVRGRAGDDLLDSYHAERHRVGRRVLANIEAQAQLLLGDPGIDPLRTLLAELIGRPAVRETLAGMISGVDIRYGGAGHPTESAAAAGPVPPGVRLPHCVLLTGTGQTTPSRLLRSGRGLLIDLSGGAGDRLPDLSGWAERITVLSALPERGSELDGLRTVLVRPDGYIAWTDATEQDVLAALSRWFGPPLHQARAAGTR